MIDDSECYACDGTGHFTETIEGADGRDHEIDYVCGVCGGTRVAW